MSGPGRMLGGGPPPSRSSDFRGSAKRLLGQFRPERSRLTGMVAFGLAGVGLSVLGPKILGDATDLIFAGWIGKRLPEGVSREQVLERMREKGDTGVADMLSGTEFTPGEGVDFGALGHVLLLVLAVYAVAGLMMLVSGRLSVRAINNTVFALREQVEAKLSRLPLSYFDRQTRGEVLSRVTNDIDNIGQTLQQTLGQIVNSLLTVAGVLVMMFWISPLLALVALVTVPVSLLVATRLGKRAQPQFVRQWADTGRLNAHVEEMYTGHSLVKVFGRQEESAEVFRERNEALYRASYKAQFVSGVMQPAMMFVANLNYVMVAVAGGLRVASGALSIGDVQAFVQYSRQFSQPLNQIASMANMVQSGVASAERVFEILDAEEQSPEPSARSVRNGCAAGRAGARLLPLHGRPSPHRGSVAGRRTGQHRGHRRPDRRG